MQPAEAVAKNSTKGGSQERVWKSDLYQLQQEAPKPQPVLSVVENKNTKYFGAEHHGSISHSHSVKLLTEDGMYLVRTSRDGQQTLSIRISGAVKNFKIFFDENDRTFFVKNKRFGTIGDLVADGLVTMYIENKAGSYLEKMYSYDNYEKSPYMTLNRLKMKTLEKTKKMKSGNNNFGEEKKRDSYDKAHSFKTYNFKGLNWCEFCGNFLWGFSAQGVKCDDCGFSAHHKCSEKVPSDCCPDLSNLRGIFGVDLTTLTKALKTSRPFVVDKCVEEIERRGLANAEGLYRVPGFSDHVENLKMAFDKDGEKTELSPVVFDNVNVIAGTLKLFLRLLPIPIITFEVHPMLCSAAENRVLSEQVSALKLAVNCLPVAHYHTLKYLVEHLARVASSAETNKMSAHNIATVFAPTLMPALELPSLNSQGGIPGMDTEIAVIEAIITNHSLIF
ncbi:N-chimaerin [Cloeon dipterum]|uniref:N-chimaerin n=1 Tax=Cloeon dipterum TaxID=197152 RepID=UPI00321FC6D1